jgi:uncharacterized protein
MSETNSAYRADEPPQRRRPEEPLETSNRPELPVALQSIIADPGPLGLGAFAMTTFVLSVINAGLLPSTATPEVLPLALFYGGLAQLLAGMWEFRKGNTFGALAFSSFGAFWLSYFYYASFVAGGLGPEAGQATGLFLLAWAIFTGYMMIASLRVSVAVLSVFVALFLTYIALLIGAFAASNTFQVIGGWLGIVTALLAWYCSFAGVTNFTFKRTVLPTGPLG